MQLKQYLKSIEKDYLPIKKFKIGYFLAEKYLGINNEKINKIIDIHYKTLLSGKEEIFCDNVEKEILDTKLKLVSLVSGSGTTMNSLVEKIKTGELGLIKIAGAIASKPGFSALERAIDHVISTYVLHGSLATNTDSLIKSIRLFDADVIIGNGWLPLIPKEVIESFEGIILNQHPGPLRENGLDFGGKGMYGTRVTAARIIYLLESGLTGKELFTESTIHIMTAEFDKGYSVGVEKLDIQFKIEEYKEKIINLDKSVEIKKQELLKEMIIDINNKLLTLEHKNVAKTIAKVGKTKTSEKHSSYDEVLVLEKNKEILEEAKKEAIQMFPNG